MTRRPSSAELSRQPLGDFPDGSWLALSWRIWLLGLITICGAAAVMAFHQIRPSDEHRIQSVCRELASDAERGDVASMAGLVSLRYRDERGLGHDQVLQALGAYLQSKSWKRIQPVTIVVGKIDKDRASATAKLLLAQAGSIPLDSSQTDAVQLDLQLAREDGHWRVLSAEDWELPAHDFDLPQGE